MPDQSAVLLVFMLAVFGFVNWPGARGFVLSIRSNRLSSVLPPVAVALLWLMTWDILKSRREALFQTLPVASADTGQAAYGLMIALGPFLALAAWHGLCCKVHDRDG